MSAISPRNAPGLLGLLIVLALCRVLAIPGAWAAVEVDLELALAADISDSMDPDEQALQRRGYAAAFRDPGIINAIERGEHGRIAVTFVEWADLARPRVVVPWTLIDGPESAAAFADALERSRIGRMGRTSISGALSFAAHLIETNEFRGRRRVIDISGDGPNNQGAPVHGMRDSVVAQGIVINGLPIQIKPNNPRNPFEGGFDLSLLDIYYEDCVIGGPGAFMVPIKSLGALVAGIRFKLFLEIAGRPAGVQPVAWRSAPRIPC